MRTSRAPKSRKVQIDYTSFASPPTQKSMIVSPAALDRAATCIGNLNAFQKGAPSTVSTLAQQWRVAIARDCLDFNGGQSALTRSSSYGELERTEKGFMSGLLGGVLSKLVAERVFGARYFGHIEYFPRKIVYSSPNRRPDFIGLAPGGTRNVRAVVVESKGRSNYFPGTLKQVERAKEQVAAVAAVAGASSIERYVQYSHFAGAEFRLHASLYDPPGDNREFLNQGNEVPAEMSISEVDLSLYYRPLVHGLLPLESTSVQFRNGEYIMTLDPLLGIATGLPKAVFDAAESPNSAFERDLGTNPAAAAGRNDVLDWWAETPISDSGVADVNIGPDGVVVVGAYPEGFRSA